VVLSVEELARLLDAAPDRARPLFWRVSDT
jgi:hypothetical protein